MDFPSHFAVLAIVAASVALFVSDKVRVDMVAMLVLVTLLLTGLVPQAHILDGFANPATMTVAAMFVLSAALERTGVVRLIAARLHKLAGRTRGRLTGVFMVACGGMSAFINNTATVAVLLPVALRMSRERGISPTRVLMPLSFAAQFGGVCTLIGTTTNLLVNAVAVEEGLAPFNLFEFAQLGLVCFAAGTVYMLIAGRYLLGDRATASATAEYRLQDYVAEMQVLAGSPLIGQTGQANALNDIGGVRVLEIIRDGTTIWAPQASEINEGDILLIRGDMEQVMGAATRLKLRDWAEGHLSDAHLTADDVTMMEVMIPAGSHLIGRTLTQLDFYWRYHAAVLGVRRRAEAVHKRMADIVFQEGDTLLLQGHREDLNHLADERDFLLFKDLSNLRVNKRRAALSVLIMLWVVVAAATGVVSVLTAALVGAVAMVASGCLRGHDVYDAIDWKVIIMLAGLIPLGYAMRTTGTVDWIVTGLMDNFGSHGPLAALAVIYALTMLFTALMSNAATAVLLAPLAVATATSLGVDAKPLLMAVAFAASTTFTTPVGYQTNTMIYGPGAYTYMDFVRVGLPLNIIFFVISVTLIPKIWPF